MTNENILTEEQRLGILERVGIRLDTPLMAEFWEYVGVDYQDELKIVCDELIEETASEQNDIIKQLISIIDRLFPAAVGDYDHDQSDFDQADEAYAEFEAMNDMLQPYIEQLPQGI